MEYVNVILFDNFTTLDALGPTEVLSRLKDRYTVSYYSVEGGLISSSTGAKTATGTVSEIQNRDILLIPGGFGTRELVNDDHFLGILKLLADESKVVLSVCTGSALLAKTGLLDDKKATSNKMSWEWATQQGEKVQWVRKARWVVDGKYYTSSGITAGIDMALGFVADVISVEAARKISASMEYIWNDNKDADPFA